MDAEARRLSTLPASDLSAAWATSGADREGPWLFGAFCAADVMFAPVASRFQTYDVSLSGQANLYLTQLLSHPLVAEWFRLGQMEPEVIEQFELPQRAS
jgi:glutathione S-transferase